MREPGNPKSQVAHESWVPLRSTAPCIEASDIEGTRQQVLSCLAHAPEHIRGDQVARLPFSVRERLAAVMPQEHDGSEECIAKLKSMRSIIFAYYRDCKAQGRLIGRGVGCVKHNANCDMYSCQCPAV